MTSFKNDVIIGSLFMVGIFGFISGEFIVSTVLFAAAAIFSNMFLSRKVLG
jgi:CheY-specific phosphatase CheX